jgi:hypothetical protein
MPFGGSAPETAGGRGAVSPVKSTALLGQRTVHSCVCMYSKHHEYKLQVAMEPAAQIDDFPRIFKNKKKTIRLRGN